MDKVWLQHYPQGIPAEAEYRAYRSLKEILTATCARFADRPAYGNLGVTITTANSTSFPVTSAPTCRRSRA